MTATDTLLRLASAFLGSLLGIAAVLLTVGALAHRREKREAAAKAAVGLSDPLAVWSAFLSRVDTCTCPNCTKRRETERAALS